MPKTTIKELQGEIKELHAEIASLHGVLEVDLLTGLYNRHGFIKRAEGFLKEIEWGMDETHKERRKFPNDFILIFIDLDNFKVVNDKLGHGAGDEVLKMVSAFLKKNIKSMDVAARWSGDEFIVGLVGVGKKVGLKTAKRLCKKLSEQKIKVSKNKSINISGSFGLVSAMDVYHEGMRLNVSIMIEKADEAMYKAKREFGKNFVIDYSEAKEKAEKNLWRNSHFLKRFKQLRGPKLF